MGTSFGTLALAVTGSLPSAPDTNCHIGATGAFDNDGHTDLLWRHGVTGANAIWLMNGTARIGTVSLPIAIGCSNPSPT